MATTTTAVLTYFNGRGRAAQIRLMLAAAGIEYEEDFVKTDKDFKKLKSDGKLQFLQVPLLTIDGLQLVQTDSIVRYLARRAGMDGDTPEEKARVDMYYDGSRDFWKPFLLIAFRPEAEVLTEVKTRNIPKYMPIFEQILEKSTSAYLIGKSCTMADIGLLEPLLCIIEYLGDDALNGYPKLKEFYQHMINLGRIKNFLASPLRKGPNDENYCTTVLTALGWLKDMPPLTSL